MPGRKLDKSLLFCEKGKDLDRVTDREIFRYITMALKMACGDPEVRFHHLRHSFANYTLLRLMADECPSISREQWQGNVEQGFWPDLGKQGLRKRLLIQKGAEPSRRMLYAISALCGHMDPRETLNSYLHILDWYIGVLLWMDSSDMPLAMKAGERRKKVGRLANALMANLHINPESDNLVWCFPNQDVQDNRIAIVSWLIKRLDGSLGWEFDETVQDLGDQLKSFLDDAGICTFKHQPVKLY